MKEEIKKKRIELIASENERACMGVYSIGHAFLQNALLEIRQIYKILTFKKLGENYFKFDHFVDIRNCCF